MDLNLEARAKPPANPEAPQTGAKAELTGSTAKLRCLYDIAFEGICILDGNRILDCNRRFALMLGRSPEEVIGGSFIGIAAPDSRDPLENHLRSGSDGSIRFVAQRKDGTQFPVECRSKADLLDGTLVRVAAVLDRGETVRAEAARAALEQRLQQTRRLVSVGQLAGSIAHDFNNLLSPIIGYAELMRDDLQPDDPMRQSVDTILGAALQAASISKQLLDYSRQQIQEARVVDLNEVIRNFEPRLRASLPDDIRIRITTTRDPLPVRSDVPELEQALQNIAANSREAMAQGGDLVLETARSPFPSTTRHASSSRPREASHALLTIRDTGHGMEAETLKRAFEPFFTTKEASGASGLGLAAVHGIVKQHQGQVTLESHPGRGTVVCLYLPLVPAPKSGEIAGGPPTEPVDGENKTIIVVEDDAMVGKLARSVLEQLGFLVREFRTPEECLRSVDAAPFKAELLLADAVMADMDGPELRERLKASLPELKALYLSEHASETVATLRDGNPEVVVVPRAFSVSVLSTAVRQLIGQ